MQDKQIEREVEDGDEGLRLEVETIRVVDEERFNILMSIFEKAFRDNQPPYQGDLENETYKMILAKLREFNPNGV